MNNPRGNKRLRLAHAAATFIGTLAAGALLVAVGAAAPETRSWTVPLGIGGFVVLLLLGAAYLAVRAYRGEL